MAIDHLIEIALVETSRAQREAVTRVVECVPCSHIADFYRRKWSEHPCIAWNLLRRGYAQWAAGKPEHLNNLYDY